MGVLRALRRQAGRALVSPLARRVVDDRLTYLSYGRIRNLESCLRQIERRSVPGALVEAGVALGGSAILLASHLSDGRRFAGYDLFGQIPPPSHDDGVGARERYAEIEAGASTGIDGDDYYGYMNDLYVRVVDSFERYGLAVDGRRISLHKGLFEDTLEISAPVALAHIDCDWHDPVALCLERIYPHLSPGGFIVLDDYHDYEGCRAAADRFMAEEPEIRVVTDRRNLVLQRG